MSRYDAVIIGAGPAGLSAAYQLAKGGRRVLLLEKDPHQVGGLARTLRHGDYLLDIGGHRFFTWEPRVQEFWQEILAPPDFSLKRRSSSIAMGGNLIPYPLRFWETLKAVGVGESLGFMLSFLASQLRSAKEIKTFEDWMRQRFGNKLYQKFFRFYTEKVWGRPGGAISKDWAAQRIQDFSLGAAFWSALFGRGRQRSHRTLQEFFHYPKFGPGMMWRECADKARKFGANIRMGVKVQTCRMQGGKWRVEFEDARGVQVAESDHLVSTIAIPQLLDILPVPQSVPIRRQARQFQFRSLVVVAVMFRDQDNSFADNWVYVHDPEFRVGRIQNYKRWSPHMVPSRHWACLGLEYFCDEGDALWCTPGHKLAELAWEELRDLGMVGQEKVSDYKVVRVPQAYPVYDLHYRQRLQEVTGWLADHFPSLRLCGRNGMHRYDNQDHAILSAMSVADAIGKEKSRRAALAAQASL